MDMTRTSDFVKIKMGFLLEIRKTNLIQKYQTIKKWFKLMTV